jgi:endo-1,4-beta-D-glucanase Y
MIAKQSKSKRPFLARIGLAAALGYVAVVSVGHRADAQADPVPGTPSLRKLDLRPPAAPRLSLAALGHPFGTHGNYVQNGVIHPNNHSAAQLDEATAAFYDQWRSAYLVPACDSSEVRVHADDFVHYTVSEEHGYGMLITVIMAGHDPFAQQFFDGMYRYFDHHRNAHGLMAWAQDAACNNVEGPDSSTGGDLDIAYALLLAARQWGSSGSINYLAKGTELLELIRAAEVHAPGMLQVGDWPAPRSQYYATTRLSDLAVDHFKTFRFVGGPAWNDVIDRSYSIVSALQPPASTGLLPDFAVNADGAAPSAAQPNWLESNDDGNYGFNSARVPWRLATDYLMTADSRARAAVQPINTWIRSKTDNTPSKIVSGYRLTGAATGDTAFALPFVAAFGVSAMVESSGATSNQVWLNAIWDNVANRGLEWYYGDTVKMLCMLVMSDNWWSP